MPSSKIVQVEHDTLCHHPALSAQHPNFPFWFNVSTGPVLDQHLGSILQSLDHTSLSVCRAGLSLVKFTGDRSSPTQLTLSSLSLLLPTRIEVAVYFKCVVRRYSLFRVKLLVTAQVVKYCESNKPQC